MNSSKKPSPLEKFRNVYLNHRPDLADGQMSIEIGPYPRRLFIDSNMDFAYAGRPWLSHSRLKCWQAYKRAIATEHIVIVEWSDGYVNFI